MARRELARCCRRCRPGPGCATAAHAAPALSRRPPRPHREQPDLHHADRAGAAGDGDAGGVQRLSDVRQFQDALQKYFLQSLVPDSIAKPVLGALTQFAGQGQPARHASAWCCWCSRALALMLTIDRTLNAHLARAPSRGRSRSACWSTGLPRRSGRCCSACSLTLTSLRDLRLARPRRRHAGRRRPAASTRWSSCCWPARWRRCSATCPTPTCAGAMRWPAACSSRSASRSPSGRWPGTSAQVPTYSHGLRRLRHGADLPDLDLPRLGDRAVRRGDRRLRAEPADARACRCPTRRASAFALAVAVLRELQRARAAERPRPEPAAQLSRTLRTDPLQVEPLLERWSTSTGSAGSTRTAARATCCCATPPPPPREAAARRTAAGARPTQRTAAPATGPGPDDRGRTDRRLEPPRRTGAPAALCRSAISASAQVRL